MARQRVIIGIGEAVLCEYPDRVEPGGLAVLCAMHATRLGHRGVPISRIGQDKAADDLTRQLRERGLNVDHIQSDPDLATGRLIIRTMAGKPRRTLTPRAAFDNLQWDFDLVDVAQTADGVVFGTLAQREGQSQSIIKRFVAECFNAVRVFDLTNRASDVIDRAVVRSSMEFADLVIADRIALKALVPGWDTSHPRDAAVELLRDTNVATLITLEPGECSERMTLHAADQSTAAAQSYPTAQHEAAVIGLLHGVLNGWEAARSLALACAVADHVAKNPNEALPRELL